MRTAAAKQLDLGLDHDIATLQSMVHAACSTVDDLVARLKPETTEASSRIALRHAQKALRLARGLPMAPSTRTVVDGAYKLVCLDLGERP